MRSILLPVTPNYIAVGLWFKFYERWQDEVDKVEVCFNEKTHGEGLRQLVDNTEADYVMLAEFDGIIFKPGFVDKQFRRLEANTADVIGSPRMSCTPEVAEAAKQRFGLSYEGEGDRGPHLWPNFLFTRTDLLRKTDMNFGQFGRKKGEYIKELDYTVKEDGFGGDTFTWTSLQLRAMDLNILEIKQYHSHPSDLEDYKANKNLWDGECDRFHMGSLSGDLTHPKTEMEKMEMERRLMWLQLGGKEIQKDIVRYGLDEKRIESMSLIYKELVQW